MKRKSWMGAWRYAAAATVIALAAISLQPGTLLAQENADTTIAIRTTGSNLEFSPARVAAKEGTRVRIRYVNDGTLPHNIVLVKDEADIDMLGQAAFQASKTSYVPVEHESRMIAHSELAVPGETVEMTFTVPPAGDYFFVCLYPGHYNMMVGTFRSLK